MRLRPDQSKAMLRELLKRDPEAQGVQIEGVDDMQLLDCLFMQTTCSAHIIVHTISRLCGHRRGKAHEGLEALIGTMREHINELCK